MSDLPSLKPDSDGKSPFSAVAEGAIGTLQAAADIFRGPNSTQQLEDTARSKEQLQALALRVAEDAARAVLLWQGPGAPSVAEGASAVDALVQTCVSLCTCSHSFTYGAGDDLRAALTKTTTGIVLEACVPLIQGLVDPSAADLRHLLAQTWAACDRIKKVPLNNKAAIFSQLAKSMRGVLDTLREVNEMLHDSPAAGEADGAEDDGSSAGNSGRLPPVAEERPSISGISDNAMPMAGQGRLNSLSLDGTMSPFARVSSEGGSLAVLAAGLPQGFVTAVHDIQLGECLVPGMEQLGNLQLGGGRRQEGNAASVAGGATGEHGAAATDGEAASIAASTTASAGIAGAAAGNPVGGDGSSRRAVSASGTGAAAAAAAAALDDNDGEGPDIDEENDGVFDFDATGLEPAERAVAEIVKTFMELAIRVMKRCSKVLLTGPPLDEEGALDSWSSALFHISSLRVSVEELGASLYCPQDPEEVEGCASAAANTLELLLDELPRPASQPSSAGAGSSGVGAGSTAVASSDAAHAESAGAAPGLNAFDQETLQLHKELETVREAVLAAVGRLDNEDGDGEDGNQDDC